jgi:hypothetical protein
LAGPIRLLHVKPEREQQARHEEGLAKEQKLLTTSDTVNLDDATVGGTDLVSVDTAITDPQTDVAALTTTITTGRRLSPWMPLTDY